VYKRQGYCSATVTVQTLDARRRLDTLRGNLETR
jgi:hypothetical protein